MVSIAAGSVRVGDVLTIGGCPHLVVDVQQVAGNTRRRIVLDDGNSYVAANLRLIEVTRSYANAREVVEDTRARFLRS